MLFEWFIGLPLVGVVERVEVVELDLVEGGWFPPVGTRRPNGGSRPPRREKAQARAKELALAPAHTTEAVISSLWEKASKGDATAAKELRAWLDRDAQQERGEDLWRELSRRERDELLVALGIERDAERAAEKKEGESAPPPHSTEAVISSLWDKASKGDATAAKELRAWLDRDVQQDHGEDIWKELTRRERDDLLAALGVERDADRAPGVDEGGHPPKV